MGCGTSCLDRGQSQAQGGEGRFCSFSFSRSPLLLKRVIFICLLLMLGLGHDASRIKTLCISRTLRCKKQFTKLNKNELCRHPLVVWKNPVSVTEDRPGGCLVLLPGGLHELGNMRQSFSDILIQVSCEVLLSTIPTQVSIQKQETLSLLLDLVVENFQVRESSLGSPGVVIPNFHCQGPSLTLCWGTKIPPNLTV